MSLRSRLIAGFLLIAVVLLGTDAAVAVLVHRSLIKSVDARLDVARGGRRGTVRPTDAPPQPPLADRARFSSVTDLYVQVVSPTGKLLNGTSPVKGAHAPDSPAIPTDLARRAGAPGTALQVFSVRAVGGGGAGFRAAALRIPDGNILFIAVSLQDTTDQFHTLLAVEIASTFAVLLALALVAWFVLHLGVRPLDQMAETADAIAAGDLSRRVDRAEPRTEAGRLGLALNTMLTEIEAAFDQRAVSEQRLRRFVADASHELRTPLTSIRGYAELWRQGGLDEPLALSDAMRRIEKEAERMGVLVDELLLLARLDQGRPLASDRIDLARVVADAVADARAVEPDRPITVESPDRLMVVGDEPRLHQVVGNLLANCRIHTSASTPVTVRLRTETHLAVLEVDDDGPGLGPEPQRVFERFYRGDPARSRASGGVGLGLSIVAAVSEAHGGRSMASAAPGGGSRIRIELPLPDVANLSPNGPDVPATQFA